MVGYRGKAAGAATTLETMPTNTAIMTLVTLESQANLNGTVPYRAALAAAETIGLRDEFVSLYGRASRWRNTGVDVGEFNARMLPLLATA